MKNKQTHISIGVSAYNEEENIVPLLKSIYDQDTRGFIVDNIYIFSDGSTDKTVERARKVRSKKVIIYDKKTRKGKSTRLNELYKILRSDILVQTDADVVFAHKNVLRDIIKPLIKDEDVYMTGGHPQPIRGTTFTEKAINCTFEAYSPLRSILRGGNNVFSVDGRLLAYKKTLVNKIHIPHDMTANDAYTYFCCLSLKHKYNYVSTARVWFKSPQTIKDQIRQNTRFVMAPSRMEKHFDYKLVNAEYRIPKILLIKLMLKQFLGHPILCTYIYFVNIYCRLLSKIKAGQFTAKWPIAFSTKYFK